MLRCSSDGHEGGGNFLQLTDQDLFNTFNGGAFIKGATHKTKGVCKGLCVRFANTKKRSRDSPGSKYCRTCEYYIPTMARTCGCCRHQYRSRLRNVRHRSDMIRY